jgi:hypothetical protein
LEKRNAEVRAVARAVEMCEAGMDQQPSVQRRQQVADRSALQIQLQQRSKVKQTFEDEEEEQGGSANALVNKQSRSLALHEECR